MSFESRTADNPLRGVIAVIQNEGRLLMIRRSALVRSPLTWCFPGGGIEPGETQEAALIRELQEELALTVEPGKHLMTQTKHDGRLVLYCWSAKILSGDPTPAPQEVAEFEWMSPGDIRLREKVLHGTTDILDSIGL